MNKKIVKEYPPVNQMSQNQKVDIVKDIFSTITYKYDFLNRLLSLRQDLSWRNAAIRKMRFFKSFKLLDIATGTGDLAIDAVNAHPRIEVIGIDFVQEMINFGNKKVNDQNLKDRVSLQWGDATNIDYKNNTFDVAAMAFGIRNIPNKTQALCEMERVVIPGGQITILELSTPHPGFIKEIYSFYLDSILPKVATLFTTNPSAYEYLADSIINFPTRSEFISLLKKIGFKNITAIPLSMGVCNLYTEVKR